MLTREQIARWVDKMHSIIHQTWPNSDSDDALAATLLDQFARCFARRIREDPAVRERFIDDLTECANSLMGDAGHIVGISAAPDGGVDPNSVINFSVGLIVYEAFQHRMEAFDWRGMQPMPSAVDAEGGCWWFKPGWSEDPDDWGEEQTP